MENKKLVNILLKDMGELEELVAEIKGKGNFDPFEIEFLHTRAKGIMQLLRMLNGYGEEKPVTETINKIAGGIPGNASEVKTTGAAIEGQSIAESESGGSAQELDPGPGIEEMQEEGPGEETIEDKKEKLAVETVAIVTGEVSVGTEENNKVEEHGPESLKDEDVELEDEEVAEVNQCLGDSFLKGKSVNDAIQDRNKLEFKLSNRPVNSIRSSIGINDRFQYIRELFDGKPEVFAEAVTSLDGMNTINEAVVYLQQNFKWKKNETSLKFVNLVKRRFANA